MSYAPCASSTACTTLGALRIPMRRGICQGFIHHPECGVPRRPEGRWRHRTHEPRARLGRQRRGRKRLPNGEERRPRQPYRRHSRTREKADLFLPRRLVRQPAARPSIGYVPPNEFERISREGLPKIDRRRRQEYAAHSNTQHDCRTATSCFTYASGVSIGKVARQSPTTTSTSPLPRGSTKSGRSPVRTACASCRCEFPPFFSRERHQRSVPSRTACRVATAPGDSPASTSATSSAQTSFDCFAFPMPQADDILRRTATLGYSDGYVAIALSAHARDASAGLHRVAVRRTCVRRASVGVVHETLANASPHRTAQNFQRRGHEARQTRRRLPTPKACGRCGTLARRRLRERAPPPSCAVTSPRWPQIDRMSARLQQSLEDGWRGFVV